jgi:hypothetical protein
MPERSKAIAERIVLDHQENIILLSDRLHAEGGKRAEKEKTL